MHLSFLFIQAADQAEIRNILSHFTLFCCLASDHLALPPSLPAFHWTVPVLIIGWCGDLSSSDNYSEKDPSKSDLQRTDLEYNLLTGDRSDQILTPGGPSHGHHNTSAPIYGDLGDVSFIWFSYYFYPTLQ